MDLAGESHLCKESVDSKARTYRFSVTIEKDKDGYFATVPELQDCYTQGDTYEEIPQSESISLTTLEVVV